MFKNYRVSLFSGENILKSQQRFKSDCHEVYTEEVNKIALTSNKCLIKLQHILWNKCL